MIIEPRSCAAYAPALSSASTHFRYSEISLPERVLNVTRDSSANAADFFPPPFANATPVNTECVLPESSRSILSASRKSAGFP